MGLLDIFRKKKPDDGTWHGSSYAGKEEGHGFGEMPYDAGGFCITVEDVFTITGRGTVITGRVESGTVRVGDILALHRTDGSVLETAVGGIEMFRKMLDMAKQGDYVGLLLRGLAKADVGRGDVLKGKS